MNLVFLLQKVAIEEKLKNAPDEGYQIGIIIGSFIPLSNRDNHWFFYSFCAFGRYCLLDVLRCQKKRQKSVAFHTFASKFIFNGNYSNYQTI